MSCEGVQRVGEDIGTENAEKLLEDHCGEGISSGLAPELETVMDIQRGLGGAMQGI